MGAATTSPQTRPAIAFNGTSYLVAWQQGSSVYKVYTTRIDPAGAILDPNGIAITNSYNSELNPAIASDGTNFLLAWAIDQGSGGKILAARMGPTGAVLDKTATTVSSITSTYSQVQMNPAIAFDGTNFLIAWEDLRGSTWDIYANRISQQPTPEGSVRRCQPSTGTRYSPIRPRTLPGPWRRMGGVEPS